MQLQDLNSGVIFTADNCIGCNKCISGCIALGANVVVKAKDSDRHTVLVDQNRCILCGTCIKECVHHARTYRDDTDAFFADLAKGEKISILVSPTLLTDYEKQYHNILGYLKNKGVHHIYNTGFGGDLMIWVYMNFIQNFGLSGVISQFCPVIVNYLEKYKPELLQYLMPVQSPMMCTAIYVSDYLNVSDKLAYITPCIATKHEIDDVNTYGKVVYNVTFERLMERIANENISACFANDEIGYGMGALIPMSGGLSDNIERYIGFDQVLIQTAGPDNIFPYFDHYYKIVSTHDQLPFLVDSLSCTYGCNFGTGTSYGEELRNEMTFSAHRVKERAYKSGQESTAKNYIERLAVLNKRFESFEVSSFVRQYDSTRRIVNPMLSDEEYEDIFQAMFKFEEPQRHTDCGSCGYTTCKNMAYAIGMNANNRENCINYSKECIRQETEKINRLLDEISQMNEELRKSTQLKSNFLANMSHEIRTPMNAIIGMAEMALRGELPGEERSYIQQIKSSGRSLLAIINDILDFSKIESGKMELNETPYKVLSIINDTINIVMTRIGEKNITLLVDVDPDIPYALRGDDIRIKQILVNLANNAVKFTESGFVELRLSFERSQEGILFTVAVEDSGSGIKEEDLDKLFNSFQQVDSKRNRNVEGTGLGLAISREFVRMMKGTIDVKSTYGKGSTFSFSVPQGIEEDCHSIQLKQSGQIKTASFIADPYVERGYLTAIAYFDIANTVCTSLSQLMEAAAAGAEFVFLDHVNWTAEADVFAQAHPEVQVVVIVDPRKEYLPVPYVRKLNQPVYSLSVASILNRETFDYFSRDDRTEVFHFEAPDAKILIVDDNAINLTVAKGLLSPLHMDISVASSAREAIEQLKKTRFDIVFMDHMMPDIDGVEATHMIRAMEEEYYKQVPIIALTANAINNAREMFVQEGMNDFVAKPIEMADISAKIRKWLSSEKVRDLDAESIREEAPPQQDTLEIEGLDTAAGIALAGSVELYRSILGDYYGVIEKKAALIQQYQEEQRLREYTIEVHALKSASRLIGAGALSELATRLEKCGNEQDVETIREETPELLRRYLALLLVLAPFRQTDDGGETTALEPAEIKARLADLREALDDFDIDGAKAVLRELESCRVDETAAAVRLRLRDAVQELEYDAAVEIAGEWEVLLYQ